MRMMFTVLVMLMVMMRVNGDGDDHGLMLKVDATKMILMRMRMLKRW